MLFADSDQPVKLTADTGTNKIRRTIPHAVSLSSQSLRGDLDNIVLKSLRKEPERRYSSAENLAKDIHRHQRGLLVTARPNTFFYRAEKFVKRHCAGVGGGILLVLAIIAGIVAMLWQARVKLAELLRVRGLISFYDGDNKKAVEYYTRTKDIAEKSRNEQPENLKIAKQYAFLFVSIGEAQGWDNDFEGAAKNLQTGLEMLIPFGEKYPNDVAMQRSVMLAHNKRAENHQDLKEFDKSVEMFSVGLQIAENSLRADPQSFQAKRDVAMTGKKLAQALDDAGKNRESLEKLAIALKMFQEMNRADPKNTEYPYDAANTRFSIGETYLTLKDYESALETFTKAKEEFQAVLTAKPENIYAARMSSFNLNRFGRSYAALAEKRNRQEFLQKALENLRAAFDNLSRLKSEGKLGEVDFEALGEMEKEIAAAEDKISK